MAKRRHRGTPSRKGGRTPGGSTEIAADRRSEAILVLWTLCGLATLLALAVALVLQLLLIAWTEPSPPLRLLPNLLLLIGCVTGGVLLLLTPLAWRWTRRRPPGVVLWGGVLLGLIPWISIGLRSLL